MTHEVRTCPIPRRLIALETALYGQSHDPHLADLIHNERFRMVFFAVVPSPARKYKAISMRFAQRQTYEVIGKCLKVHQSNARIYVKHTLRAFATKVGEQEMVSIIKTPILKRIA